MISIPPLSRIQHVEPQMMYFEIFYHLLRRSHFDAQTVFFWIRQLQKIYTLGIHSKKGNHLGPIYSNAFVPLFKFETSWSLFGGLIGGFFPYVRASNLRFSWTCSRLGLLSVVRATSLSFLFCTQPSSKLFLRNSVLSVFPFFFVFKTLISRWLFYHPTFEQFGLQNTKKCGGKNALGHAHLWRGSTQIKY